MKNKNVFHMADIETFGISCTLAGELWLFLKTLYPVKILPNAVVLNKLTFIIYVASIFWFLGLPFLRINALGGQFRKLLADSVVIFQISHTEPLFGCNKNLHRAG